MIGQLEFAITREKNPDVLGKPDSSGDAFKPLGPMRPQEHGCRIGAGRQQYKERPIPHSELPDLGPACALVSFI
jgi:hypothetical protein